MKELHTTSEVMEVLGGTREIAKLTGAKYRAAFNWWSQSTFPSNTYVAMIAALEGHKCTASPKLWGMKEPDLGGECPKCKDYIGKCPYCGSIRPKPDTDGAGQ